MRSFMLLLCAISMVSAGSYFNTIKLHDSVSGKGRGLIFDSSGLPRVNSQDYLHAIAEENVSGHKKWSKIGYNDAIGTTEETMWSYSTQYSFITTAGQIQVVSSAATDTVGDVGARTVRVTYLKSDYTEGVCTLLVKARTQVASGASHADVWRVNSFRILTSGDSCKAIGNLTLSQVTGGKVVSYIRAEKTRARNIVYTVPFGKTLYITSISFSAVGTKYLIFTTRINYDSDSKTILQRGLFYPINEVALLNSAYTKTLLIPEKIPATVDIIVSVIAEAAGSLGTCHLRGWLE